MGEPRSWALIQLGPHSFEIVAGPDLGYGTEVEVVERVPPPDLSSLVFNVDLLLPAGEAFRWHGGEMSDSHPLCAAIQSVLEVLRSMTVVVHDPATGEERNVLPAAILDTYIDTVWGPAERSPT